MEHNFVRMKVPELKKYLQVWGISVANKCREEHLDFSVKALELAIEIIDEQGDQMGISAKLVTDDGTIPDPSSLKSDWTSSINFGLISCFFLDVNTLLFFDMWCFLSLFDVSPPDQYDFSETFA